MKQKREKVECKERIGKKSWTFSVVLKIYFKLIPKTMQKAKKSDISKQPNERKQKESHDFPIYVVFFGFLKCFHRFCKFFFMS